jgi:hypothetical protein
MVPCRRALFPVLDAGVRWGRSGDAPVDRSTRRDAHDRHRQDRQAAARTGAGPAGRILISHRCAPGIGGLDPSDPAAAGPTGPARHDRWPCRAPPLGPEGEACVHHRVRRPGKRAHHVSPDFAVGRCGTGPAGDRGAGTRWTRTDRTVRGPGHRSCVPPGRPLPAPRRGPGEIVIMRRLVAVIAMSRWLPAARRRTTAPRHTDAAAPRPRFPASVRSGPVGSTADRAA